jgi:hypothetical protein
MASGLSSLDTPKDLVPQVLQNVARDARCEVMLCIQGNYFRTTLISSPLFSSPLASLALGLIGMEGL